MCKSCATGFGGGAGAAGFAAVGAGAGAGVRAGGRAGAFGGVFVCAAGFGAACGCSGATHNATANERTNADAILKRKVGEVMRLSSLKANQSSWGERIILVAKYAGGSLLARSARDTCLCARPTRTVNAMA